MKGEEGVRKIAGEVLEPEVRVLPGTGHGATNNGFPTLEEVERSHIEDALGYNEYNYGRTAGTRGICRAILWRTIKQCGIAKKEYVMKRGAR